MGTTGVSSSHALLGAGPAAGSPERPEHAEPRLRGRVLWGIYGGDGLTDVKPPHRVLRHPPPGGRGNPGADMGAMPPLGPVLEGSRVESPPPGSFL